MNAEALARACRAVRCLWQKGDGRISAVSRACARMRRHARRLNSLARGVPLRRDANFLQRQSCAPMRPSRSGRAPWSLSVARLGPTRTPDASVNHAGQGRVDAVGLHAVSPLSAGPLSQAPQSWGYPCARDRRIVHPRTRVPGRTPTQAYPINREIRS